MKHLLLLLLFVPLGVVAYGSERCNTVLVHPGETIYARFTQKGTKLKLISATKEKDDQAQVVVELAAVDPTKKEMITFKVINNFALELRYRAEVKVMKESVPLPPTTSRAVGGKMSLEKLPPFTEEVAVTAFVLVK